MPNRVWLSCIVLCLAATATLAASVERADELYLAGDLDGARAALREVLAGDPDEPTRAPALALLGRLEMDQRNWQAALDAWGELTDEHALSPQAAAVSAAIRPLQALVECGCGASAPPPPATVEAAEPTEAAEPASPAPQPVAAPPPTPAPEPAAGQLLVGGWGAEYEASQEVTRDLIDFLRANGVAVRPASTEVPAVRGEEVVLSYLVDEARQAGADGVIFVTTRFDFREFIQVERYEVNGARVWSERLSGGTALKERRDRGRPSWNLVERIKNKLTERLGTPELPTE